VRGVRASVRIWFFVECVGFSVGGR
jgi:hypothetical protein